MDAIKCPPGDEVDTNTLEKPDTIIAATDEAPQTPAGKVTRRRQYSIAFKRKVVEETLNGTDSVSVVARRYDLNANLLFRWRREYSSGQLSGTSQPLIPVSVKLDPVETRAPGAPCAPPATGQMQVTLNTGHQVVVTGPVDSGQLQMVLNILIKC